jgi:Replication-relaxation
MSWAARGYGTASSATASSPRLARACRQRGWRLEWIGERRATRRWDSVISPDGIGRIVAGDRAISFFLEYDRGTENHDQLETKTYRYRIVGRTARSEDALLFVFPSGARERYARSALLGTSVPVATAVRSDALRHPLGTLWLPLQDDRRRMILDLPRLPRDQPG